MVELLMIAAVALAALGGFLAWLWYPPVFQFPAMDEDEDDAEEGEV